MRIIYLFIFVITLFACNKDESGTLDGRWKLTRYYNLTNGTRESEPSNISRSIILDFSDNGITGKLSGHTVRNTVFGDYELLRDNNMNTIRFGGTKVGEPYWGAKFWDAIHSASSFDRHSYRLFIYFNSDTEKMEFEIQ